MKGSNRKTKLWRFRSLGMLTLSVIVPITILVGEPTIAFAQSNIEHGGVADDAACDGVWADVTIEKICPKPQRNISADTINILKDYLTDTVHELKTLCSIQSMLDRAIEICDRGSFGQNLNRIANLTALVAESWNKNGEFAKANAAYQRAFDLRTWDEHPNWRIWVLQKWAFSRLNAGDSWGARELADKQTALAENNLQKTGTARIDRLAMTAALRFQSAIYQAIGLDHEAAEIRRALDEFEKKFGR